MSNLPREGTASCPNCKQAYPLRDGILDFLDQSGGKELITPFQRLMQFPPVIAIYERYWRPFGFFVASSHSFQKFSRNLIQLVNPSQRSRILDLACGPGLLCCPLAAEGSGWVVGLDLSWPMLRQARRKADALGLENLLLVRGNAFCLPFRDRCFDATLCSGALHLFDQPEAALAEIARTIAGDGRFICQTTIKPGHSAALVAFLKKVIRFGFFDGPEILNEKVRLAGMKVEQAWSWRIIHLFLARRL